MGLRGNRRNHFKSPEQIHQPWVSNPNDKSRTRQAKVDGKERKSWLNFQKSIRRDEQIAEMASQKLNTSKGLRIGPAVRLVLSEPIDGLGPLDETI